MGSLSCLTPPSSLSEKQRETVIAEIIEMKRATCHAIEFIVRDVRTLDRVLTSELVPTLLEIIAPVKEDAIKLGDFTVKRIALELLYLLSATDDSCAVLFQSDIKAKLKQFKHDEYLENNKLDETFNRLSLKSGKVAGTVFNHTTPVGVDSTRDVQSVTDLELVNSLIYRCEGGKWTEKVFNKLSRLRSKMHHKHHADNEAA